MRHLFPLAALLSALGAAPLAAQATIEAGMTPEQVRQAFGGPARTREVEDGWTYWFYSNGCPRRCGSDDVVFFQGDRVVAAVLRTGARRFDGPRAGAALEGIDPNPPAAGGAPAASGQGGREEAAGTIVIRRPPGEPATVEGVRVTAPGDARGTPGPAGSTIIRTGGEGGEAPRGLNARGSRANRANQAAAGAAPVDTAIDQSRVDRERRVTPRTIPAGEPGAAQADTSLDQARIDRERQVTPRTIRPKPQPQPTARPRPGTEPVPNDTTRGKTGITPPGGTPRR